MTGETEVMDDAAAEADFAAGFDDTPTETPDVTKEPANEVEEVAEVEQPKLAQITEAQYQDLLSRAASLDEMRATQEKSFGTAFGKIGGIERVLNQLQAPGGGVEVTAEDFAEMQSEFPELAELQIKGLNKVLGKLKGGSVDTKAIEALVSTRTEGTRKQLIDASLDAIVDGDWMEEVRSDKYQQWIAAQPENIKALEASDSVRDASRLLRLFKAAPAAAPVKQQTSTRKQQLEAATTPRGTGGYTPAKTDIDDFNAGFSS